MCTVTFIPSNGSWYITSSRDENAARAKALAPALYEQDGLVLLYPKDTAAYGSWIALTQTGNAAVLLNGAFIKHKPTAPYRKSRGLIFLDIIAHPQPENYFAEIELDNIEPFTLVLFVSKCLYECRWDGCKKYLLQLDETTQHIWSSATLYTTEIINKRKKWFTLWLAASDIATQSSIFNFHRFAGDGDTGNSVMMNRGGEMLTVSITGIELSNDKATMQHCDVQDGTIHSKTVSFEPVFI